MDDWKDHVNSLNELERAQLMLQLTMEQFQCDEDKAKEIMMKMNLPTGPAVYTVSVPAFKK